MKVDSLEELESAFADWRSTKKHAREAMPKELLDRARRAAQKHGLKDVVRAIRVDRSRLFRNVAAGAGRTRKKSRKKASTGSAPAFSRLELSAPSAPSVRPLAEVETVTGVKLRVFEETPEMLSLLSAACGFGGVR